MKPYFKPCITLLTPLCFWCTNIAAQDEIDLTIDPETIALIQGEPLASSVSSVVASVVTREEIKQYGYRSIDEALAHVTGFHVSISRLSGFPIYSIRGFASNPSLLFLVNNEPYSSSLWGSAETTIGRIPIDMIDRIEVIRGPGNSVYGTGAMTGVVNIITRDDGALDAISLSGGTYGTRRLTATKGMVFNENILNVGIDVSESDGHSTYIDRDFQSSLDDQFNIDPGASNTPTNVAFDSNSIGLHLDYINQDHKASARLAISEDVGLGVGFLNIVDDEGTWDSRSLNLSYQFPLVVKRHFRLSGNSYFQNRNHRLNNVNFFPDGAFNSFPDGVEANLSHRENYYGVGVNGEISKFPKHDISFVLRTSLLELDVLDYEANFERGELGIVPSRNGLNTSKNGESFSRFTGSVQFNDEWDITSTVHATLGIGYEYNSKEESQTTPRFALVWNARSDTTLKFLYGEGVRTPPLLETIDVGLPAVLKPTDCLKHPLAPGQSTPSHIWHSINL